MRSLGLAMAARAIDGLYLNTGCQSCAAPAAPHAHTRAATRAPASRPALRTVDPFVARPCARFGTGILSDSRRRGLVPCGDRTAHVHAAVCTSGMHSDALARRPIVLMAQPAARRLILLHAERDPAGALLPRERVPRYAGWSGSTGLCAD